MKIFDRLKEATLNKIDPTRAAKVAKQSKGYQTTYEFSEWLDDHASECNHPLLIDLNPDDFGPVGEDKPISKTIEQAIANRLKLALGKGYFQVCILGYVYRFTLAELPKLALGKVKAALRDWAYMSDNNNAMTLCFA